VLPTEIRRKLPMRPENDNAPVSSPTDAICVSLGVTEYVPLVYPILASIELNHELDAEYLWLSFPL
jgi:hypothetical protein